MSNNHLTAANRTASAAIALGSNLGDSRRTLELALETIGQTSNITLVARSHLYQTLAVGPPQPDYINACALLRTRLTPQALLTALLNIETKFGRIRRDRWGARTLDLDLLLFDNLVVDAPGLQIPHPRLCDRAFVLVPLAEIAPDWTEPISGRSIVEIAQKQDGSGVTKIVD